MRIRRQRINYEQWSDSFDHAINSTGGYTALKKLAEIHQVRLYLGLYWAGVPCRERMRTIVLGRSLDELTKISRDSITLAARIEGVNSHPVASPLAFLESSHESLPKLCSVVDLDPKQLPKHLRAYATILQSWIDELRRMSERTLAHKKLSQTRVLAWLCALVEGADCGEDVFGLMQALLQAAHARGGTEAASIERRLRRYKTAHPAEWNWLQDHAKNEGSLDPMFLLGRLARVAEPQIACK